MNYGHEISELVGKILSKEVNEKIQQLEEVNANLNKKLDEIEKIMKNFDFDKRRESFINNTLNRINDIEKHFDKR